MDKPTDLVTVKVTHSGGKSVATRVCARSDAQRIGEQIVEQWQPYLNCEFTIADLADTRSPRKVAKSKPIKNVAVPQNIPHYFAIVS
jgi:hypothetical protein